MVTIEKSTNRIQIANLFNYYVYDMSEFMGWQPADSGLFVDDPEQIEIHEYWERSDRFPYLIKCDGELAGFALIRQLTDPTCFDIGQFFVLRRFKGKGVGHKALEQVFDLHSGSWQVRVLTENEGAILFWESVLPDDSKKTIEFDEEDEMHFFRFSI